MNDILNAWKAIHDVFDPTTPASAGVRVNREPYNPLSDHVVKRLRLPIERQRYALAGGVGSGKSTELMYAARVLAEGRRLPILLDIGRYFQDVHKNANAIDQLQPVELIGVLGLALVRAAHDALGHRSPDAEAKLAKAIAGLEPPSQSAPAQVDVVKLAKGVGVVVGVAAGFSLLGPVGAAAGAAGATAAGEILKVLGALPDAVTWNLPLVRSGAARRQDQDPPVRAVLEAVHALIDGLRNVYGEPVLVVDGLDRIREPSTFFSLFIESGLLRELPCSLIVAMQQGMAHQERARLGETFVRYDFANVPAIDRNQPTEAHEPGCRFFRELVALRCRSASLENPLSEPQVDRLAYASGGRLRLFMSLVRSVAVEAMLRDVRRPDHALIDAVVDAARRDIENGLNRAELDLLGQVLDDPRRELPADPLALKLLDGHLLLAFPNESSWYLPHPLLIPRLLARRGPSGSASS